MECVTCNLCGSSEHKRVYAMPDILYHPDETFTVVRCNGCGLGFVNPRPAPDEMQRYYPTAFFDDFDRNSAYHRRRYARQAAYLKDVEARVRSPKLLDVGCATGGFPRFMRERGWQVEGVEVSPVGEAIGDFKVHRCILPEIEAEASSFDAVTAWAVLEHVHDPMAYFRTAGRLLKPGGVFAFLVTNFDSLSSRALFREDVPRHLYFFTVPTIRHYLDAAGLSLRSVANDGRIFEMVPVNWLHYHLYRMVGRDWRWETRPETRRDYFRRRKLAGGLGANLRFAASHPLSAVEALLMPLYVRAQMAAGRYGIMTIVCEKPEGHDGSG